MGLFDSTTPTTDNSLFDYNLEADKLERRRKIADMLQQATYQGLGQQRFRNGTAGAIDGLTRLAQGLMARYSNKKLDADAAALDQQDQSNYNSLLDQNSDINKKASDLLRQNKSRLQATQDNAAGTDPELAEIVPDAQLSYTAQDLAKQRNDLASRALKGGATSKLLGTQLLTPQAHKYSTFGTPESGYYTFDENTGDAAKLTDGAPKANTDVVESDGHKWLIDKATGKKLQDLGSAVKKETDVVEADGHRWLIDKGTGERIKDLGNAKGDGTEIPGGKNAAAAQGLGTAYSEVNKILNPDPGKPTIADAQGWFDNMLSNHGMNSEGADVKAHLQKAVANATLSTIQTLKNSGIGTAIANSDAEGKRLEQTWGAFDFKNQSKESIREQLIGFQSDIVKTLTRYGIDPTSVGIDADAAILGVPKATTPVGVSTPRGNPYRPQ